LRAGAIAAPAVDRTTGSRGVTLAGSTDGPLGLGRDHAERIAHLILYHAEVGPLIADLNVPQHRPRMVAGLVDRFRPMRDPVDGATAVAIAGEEFEHINQGAASPRLRETLTQEVAAARQALVFKFSNPC
jgi:hypothetical protein